MKVRAKFPRRLFVPPTLGDALAVALLVAVIGVALLCETSRDFSHLHRRVWEFHRFSLGLAEHMPVLLVCSACGFAMLLIGALAAERRQRPVGGASTRVKRALARRGLPPLPLHENGALYPTKPSPTAPLWPRGKGSRKARRPARPDAWYWVVGEYLLVSLIAGAFMPTLLMCAGAIGGLPKPGLLNPIEMVGTWLAVAAEWWPLVALAAAGGALGYWWLRAQLSLRMRQRRSYRTLRRARGY